MTCGIYTLSKQKRPHVTSVGWSFVFFIMCKWPLQRLWLWAPFGGQFGQFLLLNTHTQNCDRWMCYDLFWTGASLFFFFFGKPSFVRSDNDVRFQKTGVFYQTAFKACEVKISFLLPKNPRSNGLAENFNRMFCRTCELWAFLPKTRMRFNWFRIVRLSWIRRFSPQQCCLPMRKNWKTGWGVRIPPEPMEVRKIFFAFDPGGSSTQSIAEM